MCGSSCAETRPWAHFHIPSCPQTHIKGFTKGIVAAKDRVGDRDQGWAGPFLPWGEVIISVIFCLKRKVSGEGALSKIDGPPTPTYPQCNPTWKAEKPKPVALPRARR